MIGIAAILTLFLKLTSAPCLINSSATSRLFRSAEKWRGVSPSYNTVYGWDWLTPTFTDTTALITHIHISNIYDPISYHRLLIKYQIDDIVIIVMRWRYIRYWNRRSAYIVSTIDISSMPYQYLSNCSAIFQSWRMKRSPAIL